MSLTATEEALVRQLLDQQAAILSLAGNESTITSKLGATKVTLSDLVSASSVADADLLLTRQGTNDKSVTADVLADYMEIELDIANRLSSKSNFSAMVTRNVNVTLSPASPLKHTWNNVEHDPFSLFSGANNHFIVNKSGIWHVTAAIHMTPTAGMAGNFIHALVNGAILTGASKTGAGQSFTGLTALVLSAKLKLNAGDTVGLYSYLGGATVTQETFGDNDHNFFQISFVGDN